MWRFSVEIRYFLLLTAIEVEGDRSESVPFRYGRPLSCGESVEPLRRLQGLNLASVPAGVGRPSLHCTVR